MSVTEKLKKEAMQLRIARNPIAPSITFALSEIEKVGKNNGNRATTDDEAIKVIQKLIVTVDENLKLDLDDARKTNLNFERNILVGVLPQMASDDDVRTYLRETFTKPANKGEVMKGLRAKFGALVDMKRAGTIAAEELGI